MRSAYAYILIVVLALGYSCRKKEYPRSVIENDAEFFTSMDVNGTPVELKAGVDDYYMYSSLNQDSSGLYHFVAELKQTQCTGSCPNSIKIQINDFKISSQGGAIDLDSSLRARKFTYETQNTAPGYGVQFKSSYNKNPAGAAYLWNFGDGQISNETDPLHQYAVAGKYQVCLSVKSGNSCVSSVCMSEKIGNGTPLSMISSTPGIGNTILFSHNTFGGIAPHSYLWKFGDGKDTVGSTVSHTYRYAGSYPVTLRIIDGLKDTSYVYYNAVTGNDLSSCAANFGVVAPVYTLSPFSDNRSKVVVSWTDSQGVLYRSSEATQPADSFFEIVSVEDNGPNENEKPTKKLHVRFTCKVFNGSSVISLNNAEATICVATK
jgi:hypothetical protein